MSAVFLEKDVWVCWVLQQLFTMPGRLPMAFKGGTSLSKVFRVIERFSEDVDVTLDYRALGAVSDPFEAGLSRNRLSRISDELKGLVRNHAYEVVMPYLEACLENELGHDVGGIEIDATGEELWVHYPTALDQADWVGVPDGYVKDAVLIEFGGRNITEPNETYEVRPDIAEYLPELEMPVASVSVLSPERTFWEKATLMHVACNHGEFKAKVDRQSRHWYDLDCLAGQDIGRRAMDNRALLTDVVKHKKVFFHAGYANYDACLAGRLRLIPDEPALGALRTDYEAMVSSGMFIGEPSSFDAIIERLRALESAINR